MTDLPEIRSIEPSEFPAYYKSLIETFGSDVRDSERESDQMVFEFDRSVAGFDDGRVIATSGIFSRQIIVPGGELPVGAVTMVTVSPTHRRRGVLTEMMRRMLDDVRDREPIAALWASEATIYGRFGYGVAARMASPSGKTKEMSIRPELGRTGRMRLLTAEQARPLQESVFERARPGQVGWLDRSARWWDWHLHDPEDAREGATALRFAVHESDDGTADGYVIYRLRDKEGMREAEVRDLVATNPDALAAVWRFLTELDLVGRVQKWYAPLDEPLQHMLVDQRSLELRIRDGLWVRLVNLDAALAGRTYSTDVDVVLDVRDSFCPWNEGRWRLTGGPDGAVCKPTTDAADLSVDTTDLAAAYLGGTRLAALAAAGRVRELRPGTLESTSRAFGCERDPWCPEGF